MTAAELQELAADLDLDVVGAAPATAYDETEEHIRERRARGLFADMRFTMAQPETSCHPETLLPDARTVVSAAHCYWTEEPPLGPGEGRLARYTWYDGYAVLRERLDELGRRLGGNYRVLVDWLAQDGPDLARRYDRLYVPRNDGRYLRRNAAVALGNTGGGEHRTLLEPYLDSDDELLREQAEWAAARIDDPGRDSAPDAEA